MNFEKAHWETGGTNVRLTMPLTKVDEEKRLVHGFASLDNVDSQDDIVLAEASKRAFSRFRGNIREMHQPIAVGKMVDFREEELYDPNTGETHKGVFVTVYVSKGAQSTWEKVLDGTLSGFSIGGNILDAEAAFSKEAGKNIRIVKDYELIELSLVDNPANQKANIFSVEKMADGSEVWKGLAVDTKSEYTFYCTTDEIAKTSTENELDCPVCGEGMVNAGWFEYTSDADRTEKIADSVRKYLSSINEAQGEPAINEGGVDVAEDTVEKTVETPEVEEAVAEVEAVEKAAEPEAEKAAEDEVSEVDDAEDDLAKMVSELRDNISKSLDENRVAIDEALAGVNEKVDKVIADLDAKGAELTQKYSELSEKFNGIKDELGKVEKNLESLQSESAVKKSADLGGSDEPVVEKAATSMWGGHFLGVKSLD